MPDPVSIATLALGALGPASKLLGGGGGSGGGGSITKQDNYQNTSLNISIGSGYEAGFRAVSPFPGAVSSSFVTPVGFTSGGGASGGGILSTIADNWLLIALGIGAFVAVKKLG